MEAEMTIKKFIEQLQAIKGKSWIMVNPISMSQDAIKDTKKVTERIQKMEITIWTFLD